jgi:hypothetical protein
VSKSGSPSREPLHASRALSQNKKKIFATRTKAVRDPDRVKARLLCGECEQRFNRNGEDEVLRWTAPKAKAGTSPLAAALRARTPMFTEPDQASINAARTEFLVATRLPFYAALLGVRTAR